MPHVNQYKYDRDGNRVKRKKKRKRKRPPTADYLYKEHLNRLKAAGISNKELKKCIDNSFGGEFYNSTTENILL